MVDNVEFFAQWVRTKRQARGWSSKDLATRAQLSQSCISFVENGKRGPALRTAAKIAQAFDMPLWEVLRELAEGHRTSQTPPPM